MGSLVLAGATSGSTTITPTDAVTATVTLPSTGGTLQTSGAGFTTNGVAYATSTSALATGTGLTFNGTTLTAINNSSPQAILLSRTSATARNWALGVDGDGAFRLTDTGSGGVVNLNCGAAGITTLNSASDLVFKANNTEYMRLTSAGNVGIGTNNPTYKLDVAGIARIVANSNGGYACEFSNSNTNNPYGIFVGMAYAGSPQYLFTGYYAGIGNVVLINYNGNITNYNNSYGAISDVKLKENIVDATPKLEDLCKVKVRQYNFKEGEKHKQIGVIAQELEEIFPSMIEESKDTIKDEDGKMIELNTVTKSVKYSVFVPMLIKSIQELSALVTAQSATITSLTERITALEGK